MAKDKKEQKAQTTIKAQAATTENVMEKIRKGNLMNETLTKQVLNDIEKEKDEQKKIVRMILIKMNGIEDCLMIMKNFH